MVNDLSTSLEGLAKKIRADHEAVAGALERGAKHAKNAGERLIQAKKHVKHGDWLTFLAIHCEISERTARVYMQMARHWPQIEAKRQSIADLSLSKALALIAPVPPKVVEFIPPSRDNTREDFAAVVARGQALLEERDAFSLEALPAEEHDLIASGQAVLAQEQNRPGGIAALRAKAATAVASWVRPAPSIEEQEDEALAQEQDEAIEDFWQVLIDRCAGLTAQQTRAQILISVDCLRSVHHMQKLIDYGLAKANEIAAESSADALMIKLSGG